MDKAKLFENMGILLMRFYNEYGRTKTLDFSDTPEQLDWIRDIYREIMGQPNMRVDLTCSSCLVSILNIFLSYYDREYPKWWEQEEQNRKGTSDDTK